MPYIKNITVIPGGFQSNNFTFLFSEKKWNGLTKGEQKAILSVSGETIAINAGKRVDFLDDRAREAALKKGIKFTTASPEFVAAMRKRLQFVTDDWLKAAGDRGIDGKAALAYYRSQF